MITTQDANRVAESMALNAKHPEIQIAQTLFRTRLVAGWQIPTGAKILEIGCGQGDMTAVLASAVGVAGHVTAVDLASPDYGAPIMLGQSAAHLKTTPLGPQIDFHFQYDLLDSSQTFPADAFDYVVLAHCSWYFESREHLRRTLLRVRPWARHLCFSEWDMEPKSLDQVAHLLSVLIQGQIGVFHADSSRNIRTPFSTTTLRRLLEETGWKPSAETSVDASSLKDADWEIDDCLASCAEEADGLVLPMKFREFLGSQLDTLRSVAAASKSRPLPSYSIVAQRSLETHPALNAP